MGLKQSIAEFKQNEQSFGNNDLVNVFSKLKNKILTLGKNNPEFTVRILPPKDLDNGDFYKEFRSISFLKSPKPGDDNTYSFNTAYPIDKDDPLEKANSQWSKVEKIPNKYGSGLTNAYYIQVAKVIKDDNGKAKNELDDNGNINVYVMRLNYGLMSKLMSALENGEYDPLNNDYIDAAYKKFGVTAKDQQDWSFISPSLAYPVTFSYDPDKPNNDRRELSVISSKILPPLPDNWKDQLEDLDYLASPSYKINPSLVEWFIKGTNDALGLDYPEFKPYDNQDDEPKKEPAEDKKLDTSKDDTDGFAGGADDLLNGNPFDDKDDSEVDISDDDLPF